LKTDKFENRLYSILFGLSSGLAMLTKGQALLFIAIPSLVVIYASLAGRRNEILKRPFGSRRLQNIAIFIVTSFLISWVWWGHQIKKTWYSLGVHIINADKSLESYWDWGEKYSLDSLTFHFRELFFSMSPVFCAIFLVALIYFLKHRPRYKGVIISWLVFPFLLFSLVFTIKHSRFLMPMLPAAALVSSWGLDRLANKKLRTLALSVIVAFGLFQFYAFSCWPVGDNRDARINSVRVFGEHTQYEAGAPYIRKHGIDELYREIKKEANGYQPLKIGLILVSDGISSYEITYLFNLNDRNITFMDFEETPDVFLNGLDFMDFIVMRSPKGSQKEILDIANIRSLLTANDPKKFLKHEIEHYDIWGRLSEALEKLKSEYEPTCELPLGQSAYFVFKRNKKIQQAIGDM